MRIRNNLLIALSVLSAGGEGDGEEGEGEGEKEDSSERTELLQIAWEVVDVSRIVYAKFADKACSRCVCVCIRPSLRCLLQKKELADALLVLGEVCLESGEPFTSRMCVAGDVCLCGCAWRAGQITTRAPWRSSPSAWSCGRRLGTLVMGTHPRLFSPCQAVTVLKHLLLEQISRSIVRLCQCHCRIPCTLLTTLCC